MIRSAASRARAAIAALLIWAAPGAAAEEKHAPGRLLLMADEWCPYNCEPGSEKPGYMVEMAREILAPHGFVVEYRTTAWARAVADTETGRIDGAIGAAPGEGTMTFPSVPWGMSENKLLVRRGTPLEYRGPASLPGRIGVIRDYSYGDEMDAWLASAEAAGRVDVSSGAEALASNIRKLDLGRLDVVIDDGAVLLHRISELGWRDRFDIVPTGKPVPLFIALAPGRPETPRLARLLDEGVAEMRRTGRLDEILARYGLRDWTAAGDGGS